jgi:hypothetical protein
MDVLPFQAHERARDNSEKQRETANAVAVFPRAARYELKDFRGESDYRWLIISWQNSQNSGGRGRPFEKGRSGNPAGRPRGLRNHATRAMQQLLDGESEALTHKVVELALDGNTTALRLCLDRLLAPRRDRAAPLKLPPIGDAGSLAGAMAAIVGAAGKGEISSTEAGGWARLVDIFLKALDAHDFEQRLDALEKRLGPA